MQTPFVKPVTAFETSDGTVFTSKGEAEQHQSCLDFAGWYESNKLYGRYAGSSVEAKDMLDWLQEHRVILRGFLRRI